MFGFGGQQDGQFTCCDLEDLAKSGPDVWIGFGLPAFPAAHRCAVGTELISKEFLTVAESLSPLGKASPSGRQRAPPPASCLPMPAYGTLR